MTLLQKILFHVTALYMLGNGAWMLMKWAQDTNPYKDSFPLIVGIIAVILGFAAFVISFMNIGDKKRNK